MKVYDQLDKLPSGQAKDTITEGTLVLEGGGWKGLYTLGVLDAMMENDLNFSSVVGVSAGALSAMGRSGGAPASISPTAMTKTTAASAPCAATMASQVFPTCMTRS